MRMKLRTWLALMRGGQFRVIGSLSRAARGYHRVAFLAAGLNSGWLERLARAPRSFDALAADLKIAPGMHDGLRAWLRIGVELGELGLGPQGYSLRGKLSRLLVDPAQDAAAAFVEELAFLHNTLITQTPERLRRGRAFTLDDQDARMIARSSRLAEPFICEALAEVVPRTGPFNLLEIGCGAGAYMRYAALRNPKLTAVGIELQTEAAALAVGNMAAWELGNRVAIEMGDIRSKPPEAAFDLATLPQNIYYFPVAERIAVLRHVRAFLKPGGRLLLTTLCRGPGSTAAVLDLWGAMTAGCGRLPEPREMVAQLTEAGFGEVAARSLVRGESFYAFTGTNPAVAHPLLKAIGAAAPPGSGAGTPR
jgi:SAM-dependent methyltransferase